MHRGETRDEGANNLPEKVRASSILESNMTTTKWCYPWQEMIKCGRGKFHDSQLNVCCEKGSGTHWRQVMGCPGKYALGGDFGKECAWYCWHGLPEEHEPVPKSGKKRSGVREVYFPIPQIEVKC